MIKKIAKGIGLFIVLAGLSLVSDLYFPYYRSMVAVAIVLFLIGLCAESYFVGDR